MNFNLTDALHGAIIKTLDGRDVIGLTLIKANNHGGFPLTGFTRQKDGSWVSNTWTLEGKFGKSVEGPSDLCTSFVGRPWYHVDVVPGNMDGVYEGTDEAERKVIFRFWDQAINHSWQGTWEDKGTATHWQNPGPTPANLQAVIRKNDIVLTKEHYVFDNDWILDGDRFKQIKTLSWAKEKAGKKNDGMFTIVRIPDTTPVQ